MFNRKRTALHVCGAPFFCIAFASCGQIWRCNLPIIEFDKEIYERDLREEGILIGRKEGISIGRKEGVSIGREEGISIGRKEGREEQKKINIEFMLRNGKSPEEISSFCGYDLDYVKQILASLKES
jgi:hypothetical protein